MTRPAAVKRGYKAGMRSNAPTVLAGVRRSAGILLACGVLCGCGPVWDELLAIRNGGDGEVVFEVYTCDGVQITSLGVSEMEAEGVEEGERRSLEERRAWEITQDSGRLSGRPIGIPIFEVPPGFTEEWAIEARRIDPAKEYLVAVGTEPMRYASTAFSYTQILELRSDRVLNGGEVRSRADFIGVARRLCRE